MQVRLCLSGWHADFGELYPAQQDHIIQHIQDSILFLTALMCSSPTLNLVDISPDVTATPASRSVLIQMLFSISHNQFFRKHTNIRITSQQNVQLN